jgi:hypothetical protein
MNEVQKYINKGVLKNNKMNRELQKLLNRIDPFEINYAPDLENLYLIDNNGFVRASAKTVPILEIIIKENKKNKFIVSTVVGKFYRDEKNKLNTDASKKIFEETFFLLDEFIRLKSNNNIMVWGTEVVKREDYFKLMSYDKGSILDGKVIDLDLMVDITLDILLFILGKLKQEGTIYLEYTDTLRFYFITEYEVYVENKFKIIDGKVKRLL